VPNNTLSQVRAQLDTTLTAVTQLKQVLRGRSGDFNLGFPGCRYYLVEAKDEKQDNNPGKSVWRTFIFHVEVWQHGQALSKSDAEDLFEDAVEGVMNALASDYTLNGKADNMTVEQSPARYDEAMMGGTLMMLFTLNIQTYVG
jgi:hypothetical protein